MAPDTVDGPLGVGHGLEVPATKQIEVARQANSHLRFSRDASRDSITGAMDSGATTFAAVAQSPPSAYSQFQSPPPVPTVRPQSVSIAQPSSSGETSSDSSQAATQSLATSSAASPSSAAHPIPWRQNVFFIPYEFSTAAAQSPVEVRLYASSDQGQTWELAGRAQPHVLGFNYRAPHDGEFWFSLRSVDRQGRMHPEGPYQAELRVSVDTMAPRLDVSTQRLGSGEVEVAWRSVDPNLNQDSLIVEYQSDTDPMWRALNVGVSSEVARFTRTGNFRFQPAADARLIRVRASVADQAGNRSVSQSELPLTGGSGYASVPIRQGGTPAQQAQQGATTQQTWPTDSHAQSPLGRPSETAASSRSPRSTPYDPFQSVAQNISPRSVDDRDAPATVSQRYSGPVEEIPPPKPDPPLVSQLTPNGGAESWQREVGRPMPDAPTPRSSESSSFASSFASSSSSAGVRVVNTRGFDLSYDVESVGPSGIAKVELWGTSDGGQSWGLFAVDEDQRSPVRVDAPREGVFGFCIVVENGSGLGGRPPQSGDQPDVTVRVDLTSPIARIVAAQPGSGNQVDQLLIQWTASDVELAERPVSLYYRPDGQGAWRTVAAALEKTGDYAWRMDRDVPDRFWLRLDVRDAAGNVSSVLSEQPIAVYRPRPQGHILDVRPAG